MPSVLKVCKRVVPTLCLFLHGGSFRCVASYVVQADRSVLEQVRLLQLNLNPRLTGTARRKDRSEVQ